MLEHYISVPLDQLRSAPWNYKVEQEDLIEKLKANLQRSGQVENLIVREMHDADDGTLYYEVVNGNHRLIAMRELGYLEAVCYNLGVISLPLAQRLAVETNETKWVADAFKLGELLSGLVEEFGADELELTLPYTTDRIEELASLQHFDWGQFEDDLETMPEGETEEEIEEAGTVECPSCGLRFVP